MVEPLAEPSRRKVEWPIWVGIGLVSAVVVGLITLLVLTPRLKDRATIRGAQEAAAKQLRDPSSAQFRNVRVSSIYVCGEINGKNGFGAYNGFVRFYGTKDSADIDPGNGGPTFEGEPVMSKAFELSWKAYCG